MLMQLMLIIVVFGLGFLCGAWAEWYMHYSKDSTFFQCLLTNFRQPKN